MNIHDAIHNINMFSQFPTLPEEGTVYKCDVLGSRISEPYDSQTAYNWTTRAVSKLSAHLVGDESPSSKIIAIADTTYFMAINNIKEVGGEDKIIESLNGLQTLALSYQRTMTTDPEHKKVMDQLTAISVAIKIVFIKDEEASAKMLKEYPLAFRGEVRSYLSRYTSLSYAQKIICMSY